MLSLLLLASLALSSVNAEGVSIPISRDSISFVKNGSTKYERSLNNYASNTGAAHSLASTPTGFSKLSKRQTESLDEQQGGALWTGQLTIGTPGQSFVVDFDTGSSDFWVGKEGPSGPFDPNQSSTSASVNTDNSAFRIGYGDGSKAGGPIFSDSVTIAGLSVTDQQFSPVNQESGFTNSPQDGLVGLGYQSLSQIGAPTLFQTLFAQGLVDKNQFTFTLLSSGSELFLGGTDSANDFTFTPVTQQGFWQTQGNVLVSGRNVQSEIALIIDTGTTLIVAPANIIDSIFASVPGARRSRAQPGFYEYPCNSSPNIAFSFDGSSKSFPIPPALLNLGRSSSRSNFCIAAITTGQTGVNGIIVGDAFLRSVRTTFDLGNNQVGFASL